MEDAALATVGVVVGVVGVALEIILGSAAVHGIESLF
jgi:hypothetical protein